MGHKQSSANHAQSSGAATAPPTGLPVFRHAILLNGLSGSGKSTVQSQLGLKNTRVLEVDKRFLTTPAIYSNSYNENTPHYGSKDVDKTVWTYGGRGSFRARWATIAYSTKALVFCVDATAPEKLAPKDGFVPLPNEFVFAYASKSAQEQAEILATLEKTMDVKSVLERLLGGYELNRKPILILCTKQDQPGAMSTEEIAAVLDMPRIAGKHDWRIAGCNAVTGEGLAESIDWLNFVIANPTDFSAQIKAEQAAASVAASLTNWKDSSNVGQISWDIQQMREKERNAAFARGAVFKAPPIFKTNGEVWTLTPEQRAEFVVAPLTVDPVEAAEKAAQENPLVNVALAESLLARVHVDEVDEAEQVGQAASSSSSSSSSPAPASPVDSAESSRAHSRSPSVSERASTVSRSADSDASAQATHQETIQLEDVLHRVMKDMAVEGALPSSEKTFSKLSKFAAVGSTHLVLPASPSIPSVEMELRKKHFWSKKKLVPKHPEDDPEKDIHALYSDRFGFSGLI